MSSSTIESKGKIGIVGSGLIGRSWAMLFAAVGYNVTLYDILPKQVSDALAYIKSEAERLEAAGLLRGPLLAADQLARIDGTTDIKTMCAGAKHIQECVPELMDIKTKLYQQLDEIVDADTILSSSTSTFLPSAISKDMKHRHNMIVSHPVNPPYYVPLVEIVPAPWTLTAVAEQTRDLMLEIGQKPVLLQREIEGFALNRLQYAVMNEAWRMVTDGVLNVRDMDSVMSDGLGMRYAFLGALETAHLNADGMAQYCERYANGIHAVSSTMGEVPLMKGATAEQIAAQLNEMTPLDRLAERRAWRDACLTRLSLLKREMGGN